MSDYQLSDELKSSLNESKRAHHCYHLLSALGDPVVVAENIGELVTLANETAHAYWDIDQDGPDSPCVNLLAEKMKALTDLLWKLKDRPNAG